MESQISYTNSYFSDDDLWNLYVKAKDEALNEVWCKDILLFILPFLNNWSFVDSLIQKRRVTINYVEHIY